MKFLEIDKEYIQSVYKKRDSSGHKGTFGKVLIIAGSENMQGAAALCALAAARAGSGTQTLFSPRPAAKALRSKLNEIMILSAPSKNGWFSKKAYKHLKEILTGYDVLCIGNGIGLKKGSQKLVKTVLESDKPIILDADAITIVAEHPEWLDRKSPVILTPHIGEARRLLKKQSITDADCMRFVNQYPNCILVLKSSNTRIFSENQQALMNFKNSSLAKGGSGDTLAGILTGLLHFQKDPFHTACIGAFVHNQSASKWMDNPAYLPEDGLNELLNVFQSLQDEE